MAAGTGIALGGAALSGMMSALAALGFTLPVGVVLIVGLVLVMAVGYGVSYASGMTKDAIWGK